MSVSDADRNAEIANEYWDTRGEGGLTETAAVGQLAVALAAAEAALRGSRERAETAERERGVACSWAAELAGKHQEAEAELARVRAERDMLFDQLAVADNTIADEVSASLAIAAELAGLRERETRLTDALRPLLDAAEQEVARKVGSDPERSGAEYWASLTVDSEYQVPVVTRRILLARTVIAARAALASEEPRDNALTHIEGCTCTSDTGWTCAPGCPLALESEEPTA